MLRDLLLNTYEFFASTNFVVLVFLALVLTIVSQQVERHSHHHTIWPKTIAFLCLLVFSICHFVDGYPGKLELFLLFLRGLLLAAMVNSVLSMLFPVFRILHRHGVTLPRERLRRRREQLAEARAEQEQHEEEQRELERLSSIEVPSPEHTMRSRLEEAEAELSIGLDIAEAATLEERERSAVRKKIKQRYLRRLDDLLS